MQPEKIIQTYVIRNYGNLITPSEAIFDSNSKTWVAELKADYPRIVRDDRKPNEKILKFLSLRHLGEVRVAEDLRRVEATTRDECVEKVDTLLGRWRQRAENIVVSVSAFQLAQIGVAKDALNPIVMIASNFLREGKEIISNSEIDSEPRSQRMRQYFRFLTQISLLEETRDGYTYAPLFAELRKQADSDDEFKTLIIGHVIKNHYQTIKEFFTIWRFEPFVHMDSCYYTPALQAERILARKEDSLIDQYCNWYGNMSQMRLRSILDELVRVKVLDRESGFYYGQKQLWDDMIALRDQLPTELAPLRV